eukprot:CAMPEP_0171098116 /NCGR_PEP_ID=MMETSP0766_2-20121228/47944_1 /TAXON_ID=439317 /ORGANISM="Gambierdiscus australes, Strain CAWD 149" /LENGTH=36 /DNA_ID= /DNA_START= /DNA_END= /DNA_ORIENTATION=
MAVGLELGGPGVVRHKADGAKGQTLACSRVAGQPQR